MRESNDEIDGSVSLPRKGRSFGARMRKRKWRNRIILKIKSSSLDGTPMFFFNPSHHPARQLLFKFTIHALSSPTFNPTRLTKNQCISFLDRCKSMRHLKQIHCQILMSGLHNSKDIIDRLLVFSVAGDLGYAEKLFENLDNPSLFLYNLVIKSITQKGKPKKAVLLFRRMKATGLSPDNFTYPLVLKAIGDLRAVSEGRCAHGFIVKSGFEFDPFVRTSLMNMYAQMGSSELARDLFDEMPDKDVIFYNVLIASYIKCCKFDKAISVFQEMELVIMKPNEATLVTTLSACVALKDQETGKKIHCYVSNKFQSSIPLNNALIDMYARCGLVDVARQVFDEMHSKDVISWTSMVSGYVNAAMLDEARQVFDQSPARDVILWTAMINGYVQHNRFEEALALFRMMQRERTKPDKFTVVALLMVCANLGALEQGKWIHGFIDDNKIEIDAVVGTALIDMYSKCGCVEESLEIFGRVSSKDTATWTSTIFGLAVNGETGKALELFAEMQRVGLKPDDITFIGVLTACSHGGLVDEGCHCFYRMKDVYKNEPKLEHYGCLVDLFGRVGLLNEAEKLIESIPGRHAKDILPFWSALLGACRIHGNVEIVERAAKQVAKLKGGNSGIQTLVSNAYGAAERWEDVNVVRRKMKDLAIKKTPGCSSIEVNGVICEFLVGDTAYSAPNEICSLLSSLGRVIDCEGNEEDIKHAG